MAIYNTHLENTFTRTVGSKERLIGHTSRQQLRHRQRSVLMRFKQSIEAK